MTIPIGYNWAIDLSVNPKLSIVSNEGPTESGGPYKITLANSDYLSAEMVIYTLPQNSPDFDLWRNAYVTHWESAMKSPIENDDEASPAGDKKQRCCFFNIRKP